MQINHLPTSAGIYQIVNDANGKTYVGSAVNIRKRVTFHVATLQNNTHHSIKLQRAWNKYGEPSFISRVLEEVDSPEQLLEREQYWIDTLQSVKNGYNVAPKAGSTLGLVYTREMLENTYGEYQGYDGFLDPDGNPVGTIVNLEQFSKERGLSPSAMNKVYRGKVPSHHGWTHINSVNKSNHPKHWQEYPGWISPDGQATTIVNMRAFCLENGLDQPSMWKVMQGKYPQHKGWRYPAGGYVPKERASSRFHGFISPEGIQVVIDNLPAFCEANGLINSHMYRLTYGERKTHRGWTYNPSLEIEKE